MKHNDKDLFQMGEVTKALGVTRRMLINYEELGLLTPAVKHDNRGFRYYSADNIVHIRIIRTLQNLGLSLSQIRSYFDDTTCLDEQIRELENLRNQLNQYIEQLQLRQSKSMEPEIHCVTLPGFTAFCREFHGADLAEKTSALRNTYIDTLKSYRMDLQNKMCIQVSIDCELDGMYMVPVMPDSKGENILTFPPTGAICIYYRGAYENFPDIHARLLQYAEANNMTPTGYFRNIYMEGPPTHGANKDAYITQVALPIKFALPKED